MTTQISNSQSQNNRWSKYLVSIVILLVLLVGCLLYSNHVLRERLDQFAHNEEPRSNHSHSISTMEGWPYPMGMHTMDPFEQFHLMEERMNRLLRETRRQFHDDSFFLRGRANLISMPQVDLREEEDRYIVRLDLPGVDKTKIDIRLEDRALRISGVREESSEQSNGKMIRHERRTGRFECVLQLPSPVRPDGVQAKYENGVLIISVLKSQRSVPSGPVTIS